MSLYVHIPFCVKKCNYCDFLSFPCSQEAQAQYTQALCYEIESLARVYGGYQVPTIFIGGGTPSAVDPMMIQKILFSLQKHFQIQPEAEISMEVNPGTVSEDALGIYSAAGINRLSIGLQSTEDEELKFLGRIHTYTDFLETYRQAVSVGFRNINIDLMSALPGQTPESYGGSLEKVLSLSPLPTHISAYSLIVEEGTLFHEMEKTGRLQLPSEEEERRMYEDTGRILGAAGYSRYEISNYAREGYECQHNKVYWTRKNYLGLGLGAASLIEEVRMENVSDFKSYLTDLREGKEVRTKRALERQEQMEEFMFLGLRLTEGVSAEVFRKSFGIGIEEVYKDVLLKHERNGLLQVGERICLTTKGMDVSNYVMSDFLFT